MRCSEPPLRSSPPTSARTGREEDPWLIVLPTWRPSRACGRCARPSGRARQQMGRARRGTGAASRRAPAHPVEWISRPGQHRLRPGAAAAGQEHGIESRLLSFHEVSHQENQALVTKLELDLWLYDNRCDLEPYALYAFVDTQRIETPDPGPAGQEDLSGLRRPPQDARRECRPSSSTCARTPAPPPASSPSTCARRTRTDSTPTTPSTSSWRRR